MLKHVRGRQAGGRATFKGVKFHIPASTCGHWLDSGKMQISFWWQFISNWAPIRLVLKTIQQIIFDKFSRKLFCWGKFRTREKITVARKWTSSCSKSIHFISECVFAQQRLFHYGFTNDAPRLRERYKFFALPSKNHSNKARLRIMVAGAAADLNLKRQNAIWRWKW